MAGVCSNQRDWAYLFPEAIDTILEKLDDSFLSFLSFISVCQHWRIVALDGKKQKDDDNTKKLQILKTCCNKLPLLILETPTGSTKKKRRFYSVPSSAALDNNTTRICSFYQFDRHDRHEDMGLQYFGSSFGWLFAKIHNPQPIPIMDFVLFNPVTCVSKSLPLFPGHPPRSITGYDTGVLSSDPSKAGDDYELVVIYYKCMGLARYRSHTNSWMLMDVVNQYQLVDVVFYRGKIYASSREGDLLEVDFDRGNTRVVIPSYEKILAVPHLVVSTQGDLLMVKQMYNNWFNVFKLCCPPKDEEDEGWIWAEINNLGDQALFVGRRNNSSCFTACVSSLEFPQCQRNCIYYTSSTSCQRDKEERGTFNLELKQHLKFPCAVTGVVAKSYQFWVVPNLMGD